MGSSVHHRVKDIIEETNHAFSCCRGSLNIDYAEFAAMSLRDFKKALHNQSLTDQQLMSMLRAASAKHKENNPEGCWSSFLAGYVARSSNNDHSKFNR